MRIFLAPPLMWLDADPRGGGTSSTIRPAGTASGDPAERPAPLTTTMPSTALRTGDARPGEYVALVFGCVEFHTVRLTDGVRPVPQHHQRGDTNVQRRRRTIRRDALYRG